jgi:hypothetical protein
VFALVSTELVMMLPATDKPAIAKFTLLSAFLTLRSAVEIHRQSRAAVYGRNVMSEGTVRQ